MDTILEQAPDVFLPVVEKIQSAGIEQIEKIESIAVEKFNSILDSKIEQIQDSVNNYLTYGVNQLLPEDAYDADQQVSDIDQQKYKISLLKSQMKTILNNLLTADLKEAQQKYKIGLQEIEQAIWQPRRSVLHDNQPSHSWKDTLKGAYEAAHDAYNKVTEVEYKIECFRIMYSCAILIDSPASACIKIRTWINELCHDTTITKALRQLRNCVQRSRKMTMVTKQLLASFFSQLKGALVAYLYMSKNNNQACEGQTDQLVQVLREMKYLRQATEDPNSFVEMNRRTMADAVYYSRQHNTDICDSIIETGHLLNIICHSGSEPDLEEWLERIRGVRQQPSVGELFLLKNQILVTFDVSTMMTTVSTYKAMSLFAAVSMSCFGVYYIDTFVNRRSRSFLSSFTSFLTSHMFSRNTNIVKGAIDVVSNDFGQGSFMFFA